MANKLELTWYGKENQVNVEPRILIEDKSLSNVVNGDTENMLIHGDNLLALKALEKDYAGKIKCIYIDPPYNTGSAFEHYDDNLEHSTWLSLMRSRLEHLRILLSDDGLIFISIDNKEQPYLKVLCDEIFGRNNFRSNIVWKKVSSAKAQSNFVGNVIEYILVYSKSDKYNFYPIYLKGSDEKDMKNYPYIEEGTGRRYGSFDFTQKGQGEPKYFWGELLEPPKGKHWIWTQEKIDEGIKQGVIFKTASGLPRIKRYYDNKKGNFISDLWDDRDVSPISSNSKEALNFFGQKSEGLIQRILSIASLPNDIVLDSFLGSGTTIAVAHKMNRRWIGIEMGEQAYTYCKTRLDKIIQNDDIGGITKNVNWQGGGGYRFYELAPTLINEDAFGQKIINSYYNSDMLAAAIALHEGYKYEPDNTCYWKQSHSENNSYLFVTTNHISKEIIDSIKTELKDDEFLLISCKSFDTNAVTGVKNISIKKIPQSLLTNCEFGVDNYSLNIVSPPVYEEESDDE